MPGRTSSLPNLDIHGVGWYLLEESGSALSNKRTDELTRFMGPPAFLQALADDKK